MNKDRFALLEGLLGEAFACLGQALPRDYLCPKCRNWSTFHIDGPGNGKVAYKSLENGHTIEDAALDEALAHVGLLLHC